jgi:hypothetical protein
MPVKLEAVTNTLETSVEGRCKFGVLTPVDMKSSIFCDIIPCSPLKTNRRFGGKCLQQSSACYLFQGDFLLGLSFDPEDVTPKRLLTFSGLHCVYIPQDGCVIVRRHTSKVRMNDETGRNCKGHWPEVTSRHLPRKTKTKQRMEIKGEEEYKTHFTTHPTDL